jgi:hypothetical protein
VNNWNLEEARRDGVMRRDEEEGRNWGGVIGKKGGRAKSRRDK